MAEEKPGGSGNWFAGAAVGGAVIVAALIAIGFDPGAEAPGAGPAEEAAPATGTAAAPAPAAGQGTDQADAADTPAAAEAPSFDTVRIEPDGSALVAGRAPEGAAVRVLIDGAEAAKGTADAKGSFAALFDLAASESPRLMTLEAALPDGTILPSAESVAIAPTTAPVDVAAVEPAEPAPAAEAGPESPATLLVTEDGAELLQPTSPAEGVPEAAVTIDTIAYTPEGGVQLSGQGAGGAFLRLYLDNAELMTLPMPASGPWTATLPEVAPGIYTLRADQIDAEGKVISRFETPFKRETPEALAAAAEPADGSDQTVALAQNDGDAAAPPAAPTGEADEPAPANLSSGGDDGSAAKPAQEPGGKTGDAVQTAGTASNDQATSPPAPAEPAADVASDDALAAAPVPNSSRDEAPTEDGTQNSVVAQADNTPAPAAADPAVADASATKAEGGSSENTPAAETAAAVPETSPPASVAVTVQPGFSLWKIATDQMGEGVMYVQVYQANRDKIRDPDLIYPGQVLTIPSSP